MKNAFAENVLMVTRFVVSLGFLVSCISGVSAQDSSFKLSPKTITLQVKDAPVPKVLDIISKQSGVPLQDERTTNQNRTISLDLKDVPFWKTVDEVAGKAGAAVSLSGGSIAIADGNPPVVAPSYHGVFRGLVKRVGLTNDFETGLHQCQVHLEFAWEPWFKPLLLQVKSYQAIYGSDSNGKNVQVSKTNLGKIPVHGLRRIQLDPLRLVAPDRSVKTLKSLKGELAVIGPEKMLEVVFDKLADGAKPQTQDFDGVKVTMNDFQVFDRGRWSARIILHFPPGGPELESFQSATRLVNNKIYLQSKKNAKVIFAPLRFEQHTEKLADDEIIIRYTFNQRPNTPALTNPADWKLVYVTTGRIIEVNVPFEFADIPLP